MPNPFYNHITIQVIWNDELYLWLCYCDQPLKNFYYINSNPNIDLLKLARNVKENAEKAKYTTEEIIVLDRYNRYKLVYQSERFWKYSR